MLTEAPVAVARPQLLKRLSATPAGGAALPSLMSRMPSLGLYSSGGGSAGTDVVREIAVLKKLDHPNVVKLVEVCALQ